MREMASNSVDLPASFVARTRTVLPTAKFASFDTGGYVQSTKGTNETAELDANLEYDAPGSVESE